MIHTCSGCQSPLVPGAMYCQQCGMKFPQPVPMAVKQPIVKNKRKIPWLTIGYVMSGFMALSGFVVGTQGRLSGAVGFVIFSLLLIWIAPKIGMQIKQKLAMATVGIGVVLAIYSFTPYGKSSYAAYKQTETQKVQQSENSTAPVSNATDQPIKTNQPSPVHKTTRQHTTFSQLKIDTLTMNGDVVEIAGTTDLPDSSVLTVTLDVPGRSDDAESIAVSDQATVSNGHFSTNLTRPSRPEFLKKRCVVSLMFSPFAQSPEVQAKVGAKGQHLNGSAVNPEEMANPDLDRLFEVSKTLPAKFHSGSQDQLVGKINPSEYGSDTPERTLAEFLASWQKKNYSRMATTCETTWLSHTENPSDQLKGMFDVMSLLGAKINGRESEGSSGCSVKLSATILWGAGSDVQTHHLDVMVIKESAAFTPDPNGRWGVNPVSATGE